MEAKEENEVQVPRTEEELRVLEQIAKRQKGKPSVKERHGANTWRHWLEEDDDE